MGDGLDEETHACDIYAEARKAIEEEFLSVLRDFAVLSRDLMRSAARRSGSEQLVAKIQYPKQNALRTLNFNLEIAVNNASDLVGGAYALGRQLDSLVADRVRGMYPSLASASTPEIIRKLAKREVPSYCYAFMMQAFSYSR